MQRIEKYGVIALVFLLVTILAVSLWSQKKGKSPFGWFNKKDAPAEIAKLPEGPANPVGAQGQPPLNPNPTPPGGYRPLPPSEQPFVPLANDNQTQGGGQTVPGTVAGNGIAGASTGYSSEGQVIDPPTGFGRRETYAPAAKPEQPLVNKPRPSATPAAGTRTYVVKSGETLGEIASRELGSYSRWTEIARLNDNLDPKKVRSGMKLALPGDARPATRTAPVESSAPMSGGSYVVRAGDTLSAIADKTLGDSGRWPEIARLNPKVNPNRLSVGTRLALPAAGPRETVEPSGSKALLAQATPRSKVR